MSNCRLAKILISLGVANSLIVDENHSEKSTVASYQLTVEALIWPVIHSRPDLAYSMEVLS